MASYSASAAQSTISNSPQQSTITPTPAAASSAGPGSATGMGVGGGSQQAQHKRVYQACIPCRRRKVRCDLGSVDDPHDPPCVRCRRESKECFFSATRRKRKNEDDEEEASLDDYIVRNGRKRVNTVEPRVDSHLDPRLYSDTPLAPGSARSQPLRRPDASSPSSLTSTQRYRRGESIDLHSRGNSIGKNHRETDEPNTQVENIEAQTVMRAGVYGPHDALDLLYKAATDNNPGMGDHKMDAGCGRDPPSQSPRVMNSSRTAGLHHSHQKSASLTHVDVPQSADFSQAGPQIDPELRDQDPTEQPGYAEAVKAWTRFRFVRAGWFTAAEAIAYIDYYYEYLSPLTPISPPTFRNPGSHLTLLTEEPILTVTLLTIASRYRRMPGTGGHCRAHAIHEQLWSYLRGMIERCLWGQEAFGGGFCGSGADETQNSSTAPWRGLRKGSLRTLGTIESLMILTEWHPRALHFPPSEAIDELMLPAYDTRDTINSDEDGDPRLGVGVGGRPIESWLEPAWRSDRMCWMLLSTAMGLAYELGVFDNINEIKASQGVMRPEYEDDAYRLRAGRIKRLLLIYLSQLAGRLGWTSMVPENLRRSDPAVSRKRPTSVEGTTPGTSQSVVSNSFNYIPDLGLDDAIIHCWAGISNLMHVGNEKLFRSRQLTSSIIQNRNYLTLLKEFLPLLNDWYFEFERYKLPPYIRCILSIEYEYVRIYVNSLSLQAVVERCANNTGFAAQGGNVATSAAQLSPQTQHYFGTLSLAQLGGVTSEDQECIREVVDGSRNLLRIVVNNLLPGDYLKHAPVRTYFRIISGAMFLLKTFALGATKSDVEVSIGLMDQTVDALRNCVVDDVHLGIRFSDLLESLTSRLRNRFIHITGTAASNDGRSPSHVSGAEQAPPVSAVANGSAVGHQNGDGWLHPHKIPDRVGTPANISATPFDVITSNMPYPSGPASSALGPSTPAAPGSSDATLIPAIPDMFADSGDWNTSGNEMWYLPPGAAFFQNMEGQNAVAMTAEGVNVGGVDLLEYMAMDQFPVPDGSGGFG
ncbi:hypothetical protein MKZ38_009126 [Zalerion maritima]|uniref:Zn(2)-C6 fungal-type domain-containing protein n=1 Tax=Zalerion maritima TaxID=339359 RepID=A0AAD5WNA2_9PEZI|nr:hypothetical protein MKZ38_009126 [Zalerion maritima]